MNMQAPLGILNYKAPKELPSILIYHGRKTKTNNVTHDFFTMFETKKNGKVLGQIETQKISDLFTLGKFFPKNSLEPSLFINNLEVKRRFSGIGKKLIQIAKRFSFEQGCEGRMHVLSSDLYDDERPPHIFYRKLGFTSRDTIDLRSIDFNIKNKIKNPEYKFSDIFMYYDPKTCKGDI